MASKSNRQRRLERARAERRIARRAEKVRRKRQVQAGIGAAVALVLIVLGTIWVLGGFSPKPRETVASGTCTWSLRDPAADPNVIDVGHPPTTGELRSGFAKLTITTDQGEVEALMDLSKTPCTAASFNYLAGKNYYVDATCFQLDTLAKTLTCGDPKGTGSGNPSYQYANELVPTTPLTAPSPNPSTSAIPTVSPGASLTYYAPGTIVMNNIGAGTNGGQFKIIYGDGSNLSNAYTVVGTITRGLDVIQKIATAGAVDANGAAAPTGTPNQVLKIAKVTVSENSNDTSTPSSSPSPATS